MADQRAEVHESDYHRVASRPLDSDNRVDNRVRFTPLDERPYPHSLAVNPHLAESGNSSVRAEVMQHMQQTHGNRAVQRFLRPAPNAPSAPRVSVQREPDEPWFGNSPFVRDFLGGQINVHGSALGNIAFGPAVGMPSWAQTLNRHATGFERSPQEEASQAVISDIAGSIPGPIGESQGWASLGHDIINAVLAPALGDSEEASRARYDVGLDTIGLLPGAGEATSAIQLGVDTHQYARRMTAGFAPEGNPATPGTVEQTRQEYPLSGDLFQQGPDLFLQGVRHVFTAPGIPDEERPYCEYGVCGAGQQDVRNMSAAPPTEDEGRLYCE